MRVSELGILPAIAAIGMSLAGFAGLIAALLKRGEAWQPRDLFLLRQMVSYGFAAVLFALATVPLAGILGTERALQTVSVVLLLFGTIWGLIGARDVRRVLRIGWRRRLPFTLLAVVQLPLTVWSVFAARLDVYELALIAFLAYPMPIFFVALTELGRGEGGDPVEPHVLAE